MESYAVVWTDPEGLSVGKLELQRESLRLEGTAVREVPYSDVERLHVGRRLAERIRGRPSLVIDLASGDKLRIGSIGGPGTLHELAELLARRTMHSVLA